MSLLYIVHHLFLPPKLPQQSDQTVENDKFLCDHIFKSIVAYTEAGKTEGSKWDRILRMVQNLAQTQQPSPLSPQIIQNQISCMLPGDVLAFLIHAQNAGVIFRKTQSGTVYEAFEASPPAKAVMGNEGKLLCSYPGPAIEIPSEIVDDARFQKELASFLSRMDYDVLDSAATATKAGSTVLEERDTAHPRYITQLLTGILRGLGKPAEVLRIQKRIADDVLFSSRDKDAKPWRRSSLWLVLRVALQTILYDDNTQNADYKSFIVFAMAQVLQHAISKDLPSDLIFCMRTKVSRRLFKLGSSAPDFVQKIVQAVGNAAEEVLQKRWRRVQKSRAMSPPWTPGDLDLLADTRLSLHTSAPFLREVLASKFTPDPPILFEPRHSPRSRHIFSPEALNGHCSVALADFEMLVQNDLDRWVQKNLESAQDTETNSPCVKLATCIDQYHTSAQRLYASNPEDMSTMFLTIFDLWVALDTLVMKKIPLLAEYSPEIPLEMLESLLLRKSKSFQRLSSIVQHLRRRHANAKHEFSIFMNNWSSYSFGVRYFKDSSSHQSLKSRIEADATAERSRKVDELHNKNAEHNRLETQAHRLSCEYHPDYRGYRHHSSWCQKCALQNKASSLQIDVHEWPLSTNPYEAEATVFELECPIPFGVWRATTYKILNDMCTSRKSSKSRAYAPISLRDYDGLQQYHRSVPPQAQRIALASATQSFLRTHYSQRHIPTTTEQICVNNGLRLAPIDSSEDAWVDNCFTDVGIADICTFQIPPSSPYKFLQYAINATSHTPNKIIANQSDCHKDISLHEYIAFASLRAGCRLQWLNIAREIPARSLTFRSEEVVSLMTQAAHQIGYLSDRHEWEWHAELADKQFGRVLLDQLENLMHNIKANWLEAATMRTTITLTCRLLASTPHPCVISQACSILRDARDIILEWMKQLTKKLQESRDENETSAIQQSLCEIAITCRATYDVDPIFVERLLAGSQDVAVLLECGIVVHDNRPSSLVQLPPTFKFLLERDRRLSHFLEPTLHQMITRDCAGLHQAIAALWPAYRVGTPWSLRPSPNDRWVSCETQSRQRVDLNILEGRLLVDGKPLSRLPREIINHPTYVRTFGKKIFDVIPSDLPGFDYASRTKFYEYQILFALRPNEGRLVIRTRRDEEVLELIPHDKFCGDFPELFLTEHAHWLDLSTHDIEFRPLQDQWTPSQGNWRIISFSSGLEIMRRGHHDLIDIRSSTFHMISSRLRPLECPEYLTLTYCPSQSPSLSVELPRFRLAFFLNESRARQLESHNLPGMEIDEDQSSGTMFGLMNQLVLRAKTLTTPQRLSRCVLVPSGKINFNQHDAHTEITIDTGSQRKVEYHKYQIDPQLGRLISDVRLVSKLYKAFLHAVTSHCLPDPLTGCTGTEEALTELHSASCQSFQTLTTQEVNILDLISSLPPQRTFYPPRMTVMQAVQWSQLPAMAQHDSYWVVAKQILEHARRLRLSQGDSRAFELSSAVDERLLRRAAHRNAIHYPQHLRVLLSPAVTDIKYASRDLELAGESSVCGLSSMVKAWSKTAHPSCQLFDMLKEWCHVSGPVHDLSLSYSPVWLKLDLPSEWLSLYNLCRNSNMAENRWQLAFSLCAFQYSAQQNTSQLAGTLLAFATIPDFDHLDPPPWPSYNLSDGCEAQQTVLSDLCRQYVKEFNTTREFTLARQYGENEYQLSHRRYLQYETRCDEEVTRVVRALMCRWPSDLSYFELSAADVSYLDFPTMMEAVRSRFQSWYRNKQLHKHIEAVQNALGRHSLRTSHSDATSYSFPHKQTPTRPTKLAYVSWDCLLARATPAPISPPTTLQTDRQLSPASPLCANSGTSIPQQPESPHACLQSILGEFQSNTNPFYQRFGDSLAASQQALRAQPSESIPDVIPLSLKADLLENEKQWATHLDLLLESVQKSLSPSNQPELVLFTAGLWPRLTIRSLLSILTRPRYQRLSIPWQKALISVAQALLSHQRASRLVTLMQSQSHEDFWKEFQNSGQDTMEEPDWLLIQVDNDFHARPIQIHCTKEMISPSSQRNSVLQLNMGEGKSSVIVPLASSRLADGQKLVRVVVLKALANQMFNLLVERLSGLANRRIFFMPFSRATNVGIQQAQRIQSLYEECIQVGGILVVQPEHILSFKLMGIDNSLHTGNDGVASELLKTQRWLESCSRDILDESDEILHVRYQLVYTIGHQQPIDHHPDRWGIIQQVLLQTRRHIRDLQHLFPCSIEVGDSCEGSFPQMRMLNEAPVRELIFRIADDVLCGSVPKCSFGILPEAIRCIAREFMCKLDILPQSAAVIKSYFIDNIACNSLLLLRGLLAYGILGYVLRERRWRVDYGLDPSRTLLAVPYRAKDVPALRAEFGHPDVAITLTCLSYYYQGLSEDQVKVCFHHLFKLDNPTMEYENWVHANPKVPQPLHEIRSINLRDVKQLKDHLIPHFSRNHAVIDFYLSQIVFPKEAKEFPKKIATSAWDIAECKNLPTTGFSGTNDNQYLLPTSIAQCDPLDQMSTNAKVLAYLLQPENDRYLCLQQPGRPHPSAGEILEILVNQASQVQVLLDVGAQILDNCNHQLVKNWLKLRKDMPAAIFFNDSNHMEVMTQDGEVEAFITSPFNQQLDKCLVYLDDVHTRGTDLKLPRRFRAAVTLGPKVTKDRLLQGAMRMRKLGHGQSVLFIAPLEVDQKIRKAANKTSSDDVRSADILRWVMQETCADILHHVPHWSQQGVDYLRREEAWSSFHSSDTSVLRSAWLQPEARTLEEMYEFRAYATSTASLPSEIQTRCHDLGIASFQDTRMEEEQEREVIHEIEREVQIERPPKAKPAIHHVHNDVRKFVQTGKIEGQSISPFHPIHIAAESPPAWSRNLLVTHDFRTTIQDVIPGQIRGAYLRPVNWILSSGLGGDTALVVVSPYEINQLLPEIRRSNFVHLHQYAPRVIQTMIHFDNLKFYCVPPLPALWTSPGASLIQQLNLFAGQLYLLDYGTYKRLCAFLGLFSHPDQLASNEIQSDGFVKPMHREGTLAHLQDCRFERSPLPILKDHFSHRRKGMGYDLTHMGKIFHGRLLTTEDDFNTDNNLY